MANQLRVTYEKLVHLLPQLEELEPLRLSLVGIAEPDPDKTWDRSSAYATIDKRVVPWAELERARAEAEAAAHAHISGIFDRIGPLLTAAREGRDDEGARHLIGLGEYYEGLGTHDRARMCYETALAVSLPLVEKEPQILALRRIGRVCLARGEPNEALAYYERSAALAADALDPHGEIIARTGMGNVLSVQGWLARAEQCFLDALARLEECGLPLALERAQLYNNLGHVTTQQGKLDQAREWLSRAEELWREMDSPNDLARCLHNLARLREREGADEEVLRLRQQALGIATVPQVLASITGELGESYLRLGHTEEAERWVRAAEQHAIVARTPWLLGIVYQGLGNIARARGAADGLVFYEKALQIAREQGLPFLEADTLIEYAVLRAQTGEPDEARAFLQRALELLEPLGAVHERDRALQALSALEEAPLAAPPDG